MKGHISGIGDLEARISAAKSRTETFSKSILEAREQERDTVQALEEDRRRWIRSFEEKSAYVEQLERELGHTVTELTESKERVDMQTRAEPENKSRNEELSYSSFSPRIETYVNIRDDAPRGKDKVANVIKPDKHATLLVSRNDEFPAERSALVTENDKLRNYCVELETNLERVKNAWRESDGKIQFRIKQVKELEDSIKVLKDERDQFRRNVEQLETS